MFHKKNGFIYLFFGLLEYVLNLNETCSSNLDCYKTACCKKNVCVANDPCWQDMVNIYIAVGLVGMTFIVMSIIYFISSIKSIREGVKKLKSEINENIQANNEEEVEENKPQIEMKNMEGPVNDQPQINQPPG